MNAGIQQELPARFVMKLNYVGRLGRRLLGQADGSQLIDYVDPVSGQALSQAYAAVTTQLRAGVTAAMSPHSRGLKMSLPQDSALPKTCAGVLAKQYGLPRNQQPRATSHGETSPIRSKLLPRPGYCLQIPGSLRSSQATPFTPTRASQPTNGMLFTLSKNLSDGVKFDFNYTWSHSIDNVSVVATR